MSAVALPQPISASLYAGPAVGFDAPYEMLRACHERVERSLRLLLRLQQHVSTEGVDEAARGAARDVLRYFDIAGPAHHEDEERHVLPRLRALGAEALAAQLASEHRAMDAAWACLRPPLLAIAAGHGAQGLKRAACKAFAQLYRQHIEQEELSAYPQVEAGLDAQDLASAGAEMAARRRAPR
jgi:hemerythrin-like domain-containing protein